MYEGIHIYNYDSTKGMYTVSDVAETYFRDNFLFDYQLPKKNSTIFLPQNYRYNV